MPIVSKNKTQALNIVAGNIALPLGFLGVSIDIRKFESTYIDEEEEEDGN